MASHLGRDARSNNLTRLSEVSGILGTKVVSNGVSNSLTSDGRRDERPDGENGRVTFMVDGAYDVDWCDDSEVVVSHDSTELYAVLMPHG